MFSAAETAKIEQPFARTRERHAHAIEQVDDRGRHLAHCFRWRLIGEKVAAVDRVVKVQPGGIVFAFGVNGAVDAALCANRVRTLHGNDRKQIDSVTTLSDLHRGGETGEPTANDRDLQTITCHYLMMPPNSPPS